MSTYASCRDGRCFRVGCATCNRRRSGEHPAAERFSLPNPEQVETTIPARVAEIVAKHGGIRPAARVLKMTPQYLYRLGTGEKKNASAAVLRKLGLIRVVTYIRASNPSSTKAPR